VQAVACAGIGVVAFPRRERLSPAERVFLGFTVVYGVTLGGAALVARRRLIARVLALGDVPRVALATTAAPMPTTPTPSALLTVPHARRPLQFVTLAGRHVECEHATIAWRLGDVTAAVACDTGTYIAVGRRSVGEVRAALKSDDDDENDDEDGEEHTDGEPTRRRT